MEKKKKENKRIFVGATCKEDKEIFHKNIGLKKNFLWGHGQYDVMIITVRNDPMLPSLWCGQSLTHNSNCVRP